MTTIRAIQPGVSPGSLHNRSDIAVILFFTDLVLHNTKIELEAPNWDFSTHSLRDGIQGVPLHLPACLSTLTLFPSPYLPTPCIPLIPDGTTDMLQDSQCKFLTSGIHNHHMQEISHRVFPATRALAKGTASSFRGKINSVINKTILRFLVKGKNGSTQCKISQ